jgi:hypothetical protein
MIFTPRARDANESRPFPGSLIPILRPENKRFTAIGSKFLLLAAVAIQTASVPAYAGGVSAPAGIFRPNATPGWKNSWFSVDIDLGASRLVVGSDQGSAYYPGMVHIYQRVGGIWQLEKVLSYLDAYYISDFGSDVALSEDERTLFVGAPLDGTSNHGAVHIFHYNETVGWTAAGKLVAPDGVELDHFGGSLDVSGDHLAVAAYRTNDMAFDSGSIYMFARQTDGTWSQTQKINLADGAASDLFGNILRLEGDLLVASTVTRDIDGFADQGLVHTFQRDPASGHWVDLGPLTAHDGSPTDYYGSALALAGNRLAVGAYGRGVPKANGIALGQGSVYIYERDSGQPSGWRFVNLIKSDDGAAGDWFGRSVDFDGEILLVGAPRKKNAGGVETGAAYAFLQNGGGIADNWRQVHKFTYSGTAAAPWFGDDVAISASDVFIGARRDSRISSDQGSVSRFDRAFDLTVPDRNHDEWLRDYFTADELLTPGLRHARWGGFADPDDDSLSNAAEYFGGSDPLVANPVQARPTARFSANNLVWSVVRSPDPARNAATYIASGDKLRNWRRRNEPLITQSGSEQTLTFPNYRSNGSRQFFKLDYELP